MVAGSGQRGAPPVQADQRASIRNSHFVGAPLAAAVVLFVLAYGGAQELSDLFRTPGGVSVWFPPAALTLTLLIVTPPRVGVPTVILTRVLWSMVLGSGAPLWLTTVNAVAVAVVYGLAALVIRRSLATEGAVRNAVPAAASFLLVGAGLGPLGASMLTRFSVSASGRASWSAYWPTVFDFWVGDAVAVATLVPLLWAGWRLFRTRPSASQMLELAGGSGIAATVGWFALRTDLGGSAPLYLVLVPLLVLAVRHSSIGAALGCGVVALAVTLGTTTESAVISVEATHAFLIAMSIVILSVGAVEQVRRAATEELELSEQRFRQMIDSVEDYAIFRLDPQGRVATWNEGAQRLKQYEAGEIIGQHISVLHTDEAREADLPQLLLDRAREHGRASDEGWRLRRDGTRFWAEVSISRLTADDGTVVGFTKVTRDLTRRRQARLELEQRTRELEESNRDLDQFASIASHDLQEPLRMVASYTELLRRKYGDELGEEGRELIDFAVDGARRMRALISDLLRFSRIRTRPEQNEIVDLNAVLDEVRRDMALALEDADGKIESADLPVVEGDPMQLKMLLDNLISNSLKYRSSAPPVVHVGAESTGDGFWLVTVRDNGIGVDPHSAEEMFEPFRRLHSRSEYPGTGIGLAICRRVVERHGGRIWALPEGEGLTMRFTLRDAPTMPDEPGPDRWM